MTQNKYIYPGPKPFTENDQTVFVGREYEITQLANLIDLNKITVVFGNSGTGKTSLINAGVIPLLKKKQNYETKLIRLFFKGLMPETSKEGRNYLADKIIEHFPLEKADNFLSKIPFQNKTLWWHFKQKQIQDANSKTYLVIIDQFEELGSHEKETVKQYLVQLNELLNYPITPEYKAILYDVLQKNRKLLTEEEIQLLYAPISVKLVIIIKSEKLGLLHSIKKFVLDILHNCYELNPLTTEQARRAIEVPAERFSAEPLAIEVNPDTNYGFTFHQDAIDKIIDYLQEKSDSSFYESPGIQTSLLQIICSQIERVIVPEKQAEILPEKTKETGREYKVVTKEDLNIDELVEDYYDAGMKKLAEELSLSKVKEHLLRDFIETELIAQQGESLFREQVFVDAFPIAAYEPLIENEFEVLEYLVDYGILRKDRRIDVRGVRNFYEISHEKLLLPIKKSRSERVKQPEEPRRSRRKERQSVQKENHKGTASVLIESSDSMGGNLLKSDPYSLLTKANELTYAGKYLEAIEYFDKSIAIKPDFYTYYLKATALLNAGRYNEAIEDFTKTLEINHDYYEAYNEIGRSYLHLKDYESAISNFKKVLEHNSKADYALYNLGLVMFYQSEYTDSVKYFSEAININPNYSNCYLNRGLAYGIMKQYKEALQDFDKLQELEPETYSPFYSRGICYVEMGKEEEKAGTEGEEKINAPNRADEYYWNAISELSKSLALNRDDTTATYFRAFAYERIKDYGKALQDYTEVTRKDAGHLDSWFGKGITNYYLANYESAIADFNSALAVNPDYMEAFFERGRAHYIIAQYEKGIQDFTEVISRRNDYHQAYYNRGLCYAKLGNDAEAIANFDHVLKIEPKYIDGYFERGRSFYKMGQYEKAIQDFTEVIQRKNNYYQAYYNRGLCYAKLDRDPESIDDFNSVLKINPDYQEAYFERGRAFFRTGDFNKVIEDFTEVIKRKNDYYEAYYNRGLGYYYLSQFDHAVKDFTDTLVIKNDYSFGYYNRALSLEKQGDYQSAIEDYTQVIALEDKPHDAYFGRGLCRYHLKQYAEAIEDFQKAFELYPQFPEIHLYLGASYYQTGNFEKALEATNLEIHNTPNSVFAYGNRADIYRRLKQPEKAIADIKKALEFDPNDGYPYATLALLAVDKGNMEEFYSNLEIAVEKGYLLKKHLEEEPEYKQFLQDSRFQELIRRSENNLKKEDPVDSIAQ